jgi:RNA polymerase sigma factor (sigma-70 family)
MDDSGIEGERRTTFLTADLERALAACVRRGEEDAPWNWTSTWSVYDLAPWELGYVPDLAPLEFGFTAAEARGIIAERFIPLVISISYEYLNRGLPQDDLVQEGCLGLLHAIDRYDERRGHRLSTYATPWIHQYMRRALLGAHNLARLPERTVTMIRKLYRAIEQLNSFIKVDGGPEPRYIQVDSMTDADLAAVAQMLELMPSQVNLLLQLSRGDLSLSQVLGDGPRVLEDVLSGTWAEDSVEAELMEELVEKMRTIPTPLEREILELRYGIGGQDGFPLPLKTVAHEKGCSIEWVRKVEDRATVKLRVAFLEERGTASTA